MKATIYIENERRGSTNLHYTFDTLSLKKRKFIFNGKVYDVEKINKDPLVVFLK